MMSLFLEITGLALAVLEIYFPKKSLLLEEYIDSLPTKVPIIFYGSLLQNINKEIFYKIDELTNINTSLRSEIDTISPTKALLKHFLNFFIITFSFILALGLASLLGLDESTFPGIVAVFIGLVYLYVVFGMVINILALLIVGSIKAVVWTLNKLTFGRALGAIGLVIAASGILLRFIS